MTIPGTFTLLCSLEDALLRLTKQELDTIRKSADIGGTSGLKKTDLARVLARELPSKAGVLFDLFDLNRAFLMRDLVAKRGQLPLEKLNLRDEQLEYLESTGLFVVGECGGISCIGVPKEIRESFVQHDGPEYKKKVDENSFWIELLEGMVYCYGAIDLSTASSLIRILDAHDVLYYERRMLEVLDKAAMSRGRYAYEDGYYYYPGLGAGFRALVEAQKKIGLNYYLFNKHELMTLCRFNCVDPTPQGRALLDFLVADSVMPKDKAMEFIYTSRMGAMLQNDKDVIRANVRTAFKYGSVEKADKLVALVEDYLDHTPHWGLRGYSVAGLTALMAKDEATSNVVPMSKYKNIGRNDPCPCGSGKKYKQCCGKG